MDGAAVFMPGAPSVESESVESESVVEAPPLEAPVDASVVAGAAPRRPRGLRTVVNLVAFLIVACGIGLILWLQLREPPSAWELARDRLREYAERVQPVEPLDLDPRGALAALAVQDPEGYRRGSDAHRSLEVPPGADVHALFDAFLQRWLAVAGESAFHFGVHPHQAELPEWGTEDSVRVLLLQLDLEDALSTLEQSQDLTPHARTDVALLRDRSRWTPWIEGPLREIDRLEVIERGFDGLEQLCAFACCEASDRQAAAEARLRSIERRLLATPSQLREPPAELVWTAIRRTEMQQRYIAAYPGRWKAPSAALQQACGAVRRALESYGAELRDEVLPRARGKLGVGAAAYEALLSRDGQLPHSAAEVVRAATEEFAEAVAEVESLYEAIAVSALRELPGYREARGHDWSAVIHALEEEVPTWVPSRPVADAGVRTLPIPEIWRGVGAGFYVSPPALAPGREGLTPIYYHAPESDGDDGTGALYNDHVAAHEVYPGHHLHHQLTEESSCLLRRLYDCRLVQEGWAEHATELIHDAGLHRDAPRLDAIEMASTRASRSFGAALDVLIHTQVASRDELLELYQLMWMDDSAGWVELGNQARGFGYATNYFVGLREVRRLRADCARAEGDAFDSRRFNDRLLRAGYVPPTLLREEWLGED